MEELDTFREFLNAEVVTLDELNANMDQWTVGDVIELKKMVARTTDYIQRAERAQSRCLALFEKNAGKVGGGSLLASYKKKGAAEMVQSLDIMFPDGEDSLLGDKYLKEGKVNEAQILDLDFRSLLGLGAKATKLMGEDKLIEISDAFEERGDEQSDRIASHLNMAIELIQDGESKSATPHLKKFNKECREALRELGESINEGKDLYHVIVRDTGEIISDDDGPFDKSFAKRLAAKKKGWIIKKVDESVNEDYMDSQVDQIAQAEFGMDFHQLGRGEKEWVRDEIDNMTFGEGDEPEKILTSRNKLEQTLNDISDELTDDQLDTISSMIVDLSSKIKKTIKK